MGRSLSGDDKNNKNIAETVGSSFGNTRSTQYMVEDVDRFVTPRGHGFAAEKMNNYWDKLHGHDAEVIGGDNLKDGADRVVDGINIQTKYCKTGSKCIGECFENGRMRYLNLDGSPMQIEVPSDKYDDAVKAMQSRIERGEVPGVTDPKEAKNIVRKGNFTYEQARNVARFGTVESITYDAVQGTIVASYAFGISAAINFAVAVWNGKDLEEAVKSSAAAGLKVGGTAFVTTVLSSQMQRTALNSLLRGTTDQIVRIMGPKASALLANAFRSGAQVSGAAAMQSASKLLRGNIVTGAITVAVLSAFDVANVFRGRISGEQLFKNVGKTAATVAGGTGGWMAGAAAGAALGSAVPIIGNVVGGLVGGLLGSFAGGSAAGAASSAVLDEMIEDDAEEMVEILESEFKSLAEDYLVNQEEAEQIGDRLKAMVDGDFLKDMFASDYRYDFARARMEYLFEDVAENRPVIALPSNKQMVEGLRAVLEDIADENDAEDYCEETDCTDSLEELRGIAGESINELDRLKIEIISKTLKEFAEVCSGIDEKMAEVFRIHANDLREEIIIEDNRKSQLTIWDDSEDESEKITMLKSAVKRAKIQRDLLEKYNSVFQNNFLGEGKISCDNLQGLESLSEEEIYQLMSALRHYDSLIKLFAATVFDNGELDPEFEERIEAAKETLNNGKYLEHEENF